MTEIINNDESISDIQVKFLSSLFSQAPKKIRTNIEERKIHDIATQYFVFWKTNLPIYWDFKYKWLINKITKDNWWGFLSIDKIDDAVIDEFRSYFYRHPDFLQDLFQVVEEGTEMKRFNEFLKYTIEYKILKDEDLNPIREVRKFLYISSATDKITWNLFDDLYNFLHFHRFNRENGMPKAERQKVLSEMVADIEQENMRNPMDFKDFRDWNDFPDKYVSDIEKLVLKNYTYDPLTYKTKKMTCDAVDKLNLIELKNSLGVNPRGWQRYALVYESRENLGANCRRCVVDSSKIRMHDGSFKKAKDLVIWDRLLASDKVWFTTVKHVETKKDKIYKLKLKTGEEALITWDHRFPTQENYIHWMWSPFDMSYKDVIDLDNDDMVPTILDYSSKWEEFSISESKLLWYLLGDGSISTGTVSITKYDKEYVDVIQNIISDTELDSGYNDEKKIINIYNSKWLLERAWIRFTNSKTKHIPELMFAENNNNKWWIIEWLLNTDWYIWYKKNKKHNDWYTRKATTYIEYSSISEELIKWIHILLNDLGIINFYSKKSKKIRLNNFSDDNYISYYLYISDIESLKKIFNNCDVSLKKNYSEAKSIIFGNRNYTNSNIWVLPLCSIKEKKYKSNDWWKTINWERYPKYNYQRHKAKNYGTEQRLDYQWSKVDYTEEMWYGDVVDIEVDGDHLFRIDWILSHNTGKSYIAVYIAVRQIMLPQQLVLYILPNKEWFSEQPFFYIEKFFDNLKAYADVEWNIPWLQFNNKTFKVINKAIKSKILFISAVWWTKGGRSFSANLIIFDEAGYTDDEDMYDVSYSATTDTRWRMWSISTINKETPINRFFYKKIDLEWAEDWMVVVVDIYNNEFIPDEWDTFDISWFFGMDFDYDVLKFWDFSFRMYKKIEKYSHFVIWRDPWRDVDPWGLSIIGIKNRNEADLICTGYFRVQNYITQANCVIDMYNFFKQIGKSDIVLDTGKAGIGMFDYMNSKKIYPYGVGSTGSQTINNPAPRVFNIGNVILEWNLKNVMNTSTLKWFSWLDNIRHEFETFEASKTRKGTKHHHDIISSLMIAVSLSLERNRLSFRKEVIIEEDKGEEDYGSYMQQQPQASGKKFLY